MLCEIQRAEKFALTIIPTNLAASVLDPSHIVKSGKTPVLEPEEAHPAFRL
jgi:hypothetical protein